MKSTMLAAVFEGEGQLRIKEVPVPKIKEPDDVLIEVEICGICGTDLQILAVPPGHPAEKGVILGHEYIGRVIEVGPEVTNVKVGDRVVVAPDIPCGLCLPCRMGMPNLCDNARSIGVFEDGGFARLSRVPAKAVIRISESLPREEAVFIELLACVVGGSQKIRLQPGEKVLILGAGPVGLCFLKVFKAAGAGKVIMAEVSPYRIEFARREGADLVVNPEEENLAEVIAREMGMGPDVVVDAVGSLFPLAVETVRKGGTVLLFGMNRQAVKPLRQYDITVKDLTVLGSNVGRFTFPSAIAMLESGRVSLASLITHTVSLRGLGDAIEALRRREGIKAVVIPE